MCVCVCVCVCCNQRGQPQLHSEFEASLDSMTLSQNKTKTTATKINGDRSCSQVQVLQLKNPESAQRLKALAASGGPKFNSQHLSGDSRLKVMESFCGNIRRGIKRSDRLCLKVMMGA